MSRQAGVSSHECPSTSPDSVRNHHEDLIYNSCSCVDATLDHNVSYVSLTGQLKTFSLKMIRTETVRQLKSKVKIFRQSPELFIKTHLKDYRIICLLGNLWQVLYSVFCSHQHSGSLWLILTFHCCSKPSVLHWLKYFHVHLQTFQEFIEFSNWRHSGWPLSLQADSSSTLDWQSSFESIS